MSDDALPQADQIEGAPHPRETQQLIGQSAAETAFLDAYKDDRLHHAWLITGPRGVGKATLAWRLARFLLTVPSDDGGMFDAPPPPDSLETDPNHPVHARLAAMSEPGLFLLRRPYDEDKKRFKQFITVDEVRKLKGFFALSNTEGGRRIVIVDAADEMNTNAANALLKLLEEPPSDAILFLISHQPSRLLPTIRSRCRELRCTELGPDDMARALSGAGVEIGPDKNALAQLAGGSVGEAVRLINVDGLTLYKSLVDVAASFPRLDRPAALKLAETCGARGADAKYDLILRLFDLLLLRLSRAGVGAIETAAVAGELEMLAKLSPNQRAAQNWATLAADISARAGHGRAVNLDASSLILDILFAMNEMAAKTAA